MKNFFTIMFNLIFIVYVIGIIFLHYYIGLSVVLSRVFTYGGLLLLIGICLSSDNKKIKIVGFITTIINYIYIIVIGYLDSIMSAKFDNIKDSFFIATVITIYYLLVYFIKSRLISSKEKS